MTSTSSFLPAPGGSVTRQLDGHTIALVGVAANRWSIAETIGCVVIGYGEIAALNGGFIITTPAGTGTRGPAWLELLDDYLHAA